MHITVKSKSCFAEGYGTAKKTLNLAQYLHMYIFSTSHTHKSCTFQLELPSNSLITQVI